MRDGREMAVICKNKIDVLDSNKPLPVIWEDRIGDH